MRFEKLKEIFKAVLFFLLIILMILILLRLSLFYIPFIIGFIIAEFLEPIIKLVRRKTNLTRKTSSIIVLLIFFSICVFALLMGVIFLVSEITDFLAGLNRIYRNSYE